MSEAFLKAEWISVADNPPPFGVDVLATCEFRQLNDWRIKVGGIDRDTGRWWIPGASWTPTHWLPLPKPPYQ